jgi:small conductance mechanosensitive channel
MNIDFSLDPLFEKLQAWVDTLITMLPNLIMAALILAVGLMLTRILKKYFGKLSRRLVSGNKTVSDLLASILTAIFVMLVIFLVLSILELDGTVRSLLAGAGVIGLAIGLAFQDPILNLFSGIVISTRGFFNIGDLIAVDDKLGIITKISLRSTYLRDLRGHEIVIPNKDVATGPIENFTVLGSRRVDLACGVSYGDDLEKVKRITIEAIESQVDYDRARQVELFFNEFGNSSINYTLRFWLNKTGQADYLAAQSQAIMAIKKAYDANDITIPFPIRTLDFGIKGGEKLSSALGRGDNQQNGNPGMPSTGQVANKE